jgi:hypothetical protein
MKKFILSTIFLIINISSFFAISYVSAVTSGDWDNALSWSPNGIPTIGDDVTILNGHTITAIDDGITHVGGLTIDLGGKLILEPDYEFKWRDNGGTLNNNGTIQGPGTLRPVFNSTLSGSGTYLNVTLRKTNSPIFIGADMEFIEVSLESGADLWINSGSTLTFSGLTNLNSPACEIQNKGVIVVNTDSFMTGTNNSQSNLKSSLGDIIFSNNTFHTPYDSYKDVTINSNLTFTNDFILSGNLIINANFTSSGSSTITFAGSSSQSINGGSLTNNNNFEKLVLNNSAGLILSGSTINISDVMQSSSGTISQSGATVVLKSTSDNKAGMIDVSSASADYSYSSGIFTSERYLSGLSNGLRLISSPVESSTLADIDDHFVFCGVLDGGVVTNNNYTLNGCGFYSVMTYNTAGTGNINSVGGNADFDGVTNLTHPISGGAGTLIYDGVETKTLLMSNEGDRSPEFDDFSIVTSAANGGFNFISNPYPCTLDYDQLRTDNGSINQTGYYTYSGAGGVGSWTTRSKSIKIPHNQGFMISTSGSSLQFNVSQTTYDHPTFVKSNNGINEPLKIIVESLENNIPNDFCYVYSDSRFSIQYDSLFEMPKMFSTEPSNFSNIFFVDNDNNNIDRLCINNNQSVDLDIDVKTGSNVHGTYNISFENLSQFMIGSCLKLEDMHNGIITDLRIDDMYSFISDSLAPYPRFKLHIDVDYDINVSNSTCFQDSSAFLTLTGSSIQGSYFNLIDSNGVLIDSLFSLEDTISFVNQNAGIYTIETNHIGNCSMLNQDIIITEPQNITAEYQIFSDTIFMDSNGIAIVDFKNKSTGASYFIWDFGDGNSSNIENPTHHYTQAGSFDVQLIAQSNEDGTCENSYHDLITVINPFSNLTIKENPKHLNFYILDKTLIISSLNDDELSLKLYSVDGKIIHESSNFKSSYRVNVSGLNRGFYIFKLHNQSKNVNNFNKFFLD